MLTSSSGLRGNSGVDEMVVAVVVLPVLVEVGAAKVIVNVLEAQLRPLKHWHFH